MRLFKAGSPFFYLSSVIINIGKGTAVAIYEVGGMLGALASLYLGDRLGRLKMILWGHIIIIIGAILQCTAYSLPQFIVARTITGVGIGFNTVTMYAPFKLIPLISYD
jgi:MFS family permease